MEHRTKAFPYEWKVSRRIIAVTDEVERPKSLFGL